MNTPLKAAASPSTLQVQELEASGRVPAWSMGSAHNKSGRTPLVDRRSPTKHKSHGFKACSLW